MYASLSLNELNSAVYSMNVTKIEFRSGFAILTHGGTCCIYALLNCVNIGSDNGLLPEWKPSHYLNQCWHIVNWIPGNKLRSNFILRTRVFMEKNQLKKMYYKTQWKCWSYCLRASELTDFPYCSQGWVMGCLLGVFWRKKMTLLSWENSVLYLLLRNIISCFTERVSVNHFYSACIFIWLQGVWSLVFLSKAFSHMIKILH